MRNHLYLRWSWHVQMSWEEWGEARDKLTSRQQTLQQTLDRRKQLEGQLNKVLSPAVLERILLSCGLSV